MKRYILDTGPAFDFIYRRRKVDQRAESARMAGARVGICVPILGEIIAGVEGSKSRPTNWATVQRRLSGLVVWPFTEDAAYMFGRIYADLKRRGRIIQQIDMQIAAIALTIGNCTVVSSDTDLSAVPGLSVEDWSGS
jgi:tRNA(fMet)-specific endonuclease VapC